MAKARSRAPRVVIEDDGESDQTAATEQTEDQLGTREERAQRPPEARLSRKNPRTQQWGLLYRGAPDQVTQTWVQEACGGGEYKIEIYGTRSDGSFGYLKNRLEIFNVDETIPFKGAPVGAPIAAAPVAAATPAAPAIPQGMNLMDMGMLSVFNQMQATAQMQIQMMKDNSAMTMAAIERMSAMTPTAPTAPPSQLPAILAAISPLIAPIIASVMGKNPVEMAAQIAALGGKQGGAAEMLAILETVLELKDRLGGEGGSQSSEERWLGFAEKTLPGVIDLLKTESAKTGRPITEIARGPRPAELPAGGAATATATHHPAPVADAAVTQDEWTPLEGAMHQLQSFVGKDARQVAGMAMVLATDEQKAMLKDRLARENIEEQIAARFPVFQQYRTWLGEIVYELRVETGLIEESEDDGGDEPPAAGGDPA